MKVLELFAGTRSIGKAFEARGHEVYSVEWSKDFENIDLYADIGTLTAQDILEKFGHPDPKFKPMCKKGDPCHASAPRWSTVRKAIAQGIEIEVGGTQYAMKKGKERSVIPAQLCEHIVDICEEPAEQTGTRT